ncbi:hypothetical protein BP6252_01554 [Coleophoma cylindrospora]|uniref:Uncharacterized protein n=1 Tax=Coleophoma cylindrospora TaxID=1849047 RepID=A0A3D8STA0_9HELO|nr:hypothetical protein BP6252_01554 [Coleophoma cylindrospora]
MDPNDKYYLKLWKAFRQHRNKFPCDPEHVAQPRSASTSSSERQLARSRERFETGFLIILQNSNLDDEDGDIIHQLYPGKSPQILQCLGELMRRLDKIVNNGFRPSRALVVDRSRFQPRGDCTGLEGLLQLIGVSAGPFELASGSSKSVFKINSGNAKNAGTAVTKLKNILGPIQIAMPPPATPVFTPKKSSAVVSWIQSFDKEYGRFLQRVLDSFESAFKKCDAESHEMFIQLVDEVSRDIPIPEDGLDIFLNCKKTQSGAWQNIRCHSSQSQTNTRRKTICEMIDTSLTRREGLRVTVEDSNKSASPFAKILQELKQPSLHPDEGCKNLGCLIAEKEAFCDPKVSTPAFNFKERKTLIAKLAINLLVFSSFKHTSKSWDGRSVTFLCSSREDLPRKSPYVSCAIGHDSRDHFCPEDDAARVDYLTQFAKLLLEIEYSMVFQGDFSHDNSYGHGILQEFHERSEVYGRDGSEHFLKAISACLQFDMEYRRTKAQAELTHCDRDVDYEIFSKLIRTQIVYNLLKDLQQFKESVTKRDRSSLLHEPDDVVLTTSTRLRQTGATVRFDSINGQTDGGSSRESRGSLLPRKSSDMFVRFDTITERRECSMSRESSKSPLARRRNDASAPQQSSMPRVPQRNFGSLEGDMIGSLFPGSRSSPDSQRPESAESAKAWFGELDHFISRMKLGRRRDSDRIRVAVLDTGLDEEHAAIQGRLQLHDSTICGRRSFIDHTPNIIDAVGHGTAVCDILLRVAKVDLFVAKISETANFDSDTPQRVAKAIEFATSEKDWNVNIMVLSFGFEKADTAIQKAVNEAHSKGKIIFAAASNSAHLHQVHKRVSFPARMESSGAVISIRSVTGRNILSNFSPRPVPSSPDRNFMTLGEGIKAAWSSTSSLGQPNPIKYVSGTSFATPLAAGIAACVLDFSIQEDFDNGSKAKVEEMHRDTLWTCSGIRKIFEYMADTSAAENYRIILPAQLFNPSDKVTDAHYSRKIEDLMVLVDEGK